MIYEAFTEEIEKCLDFSLNAEQRQAARKLAEFVMNPADCVSFILRGYAGTGKTTLVGALVRVLLKLEKPVCLLAPTGRAAKVFANHAGVDAFTIHKVVYRQERFMGENTKFNIDYNQLSNTLFIVDESSMLSNQNVSGSIFGSGYLLDDLIQYVYNSKGCKLLFVGDSAQLPPVGESESPALSSEVLSSYGLEVLEYELNQVVRQANSSDILAAATQVRERLESSELKLPKLRVDSCGEVRYVGGGQILEALEDAYAQVGVDETIIITRSNKWANRYNAGIRTRIFDREEGLTKGDLVMAVKNNYYWTEQLLKTNSNQDAPPFSFIANGERAEVVHLRNVHEQYGFKFADVTLRFPDYDDYEMDCRVMLDTLTSDSPALTIQERDRLFNKIMEDYIHIASRSKQMESIRKDPYYNALQIKFAYAVTCHKAQGGQWKRVFIEQGYGAQDASLDQQLRWLYTALTRSSEIVYLINWPKGQYEGEDMD